MTAVDTNVLIRILAADHAEQTAAAQRILAAGPVWVSKTVLLEADWVLRSTYKADQASVRDLFVGLLGLDNVHAEDETAVSAALKLVDQGLEFADALHLCSRPPGANFVSFDRALVRRANRAGVAGVSEIPTTN